MTTQTRRGALLAAVAVPLAAAAPMAQAAARQGNADNTRQTAQDWFTAFAAGQLGPQTHPAITLVLHGAGAGLDGTAERFDGRTAVAAVLAGMGPARCTVTDALADGDRVALRGTAILPGNRTAAFAAFVTLRDGQVVHVERHLDRVTRRA